MQHFTHLKYFQIFIKPIIRILLVCFSHLNLKSNKLVCQRTINEICSLKDVNCHLAKSTPTISINSELLCGIHQPQPLHTFWGDYYQNKTKLFTLAEQINLTSIKKCCDIRSSDMLLGKILLS